MAEAIVGAYVRVHRGGYVVGLVLLRDGKIEDARSRPAPTDAASRALAELDRGVIDYLTQHKPAVLVLRESEPRRRMTCAMAPWAEGVILAAAGKRDVAVETVTGPGLRVPAGLPKGAKVEASVNALCGRIAGAPKERECREAAAAAVVVASRLAD